MKKMIGSKRILSTIVLFAALSVHPAAAQHLDVHKPEPPAPDRWTHRFSWQLPNKVMKEIGVQGGMTVADIGAGDGYFSFYLAEKVGPSGRVYASDIDEKGLRNIRERAAREKIENISVIKGTPEDPSIPERAVDIALIVNVLPAISDPKPFFSNIAKGLKPGGSLVIIQWAAEKIDREETDWASPKEYALRTCLRQIYDGGFEVERILTFLPLQNIFLCKPRGS